MPMNLQTERLDMRPLCADDLEHYCALYADPDVMRFLGPVRTREQTQERLGQMIDHWRKHGFGIWSLFEKSSGRFVGRCGFGHLHEMGDVELAYTIHREFWNRGLTTEAGRQIVPLAFGHWKLPRLIALAEPGNVASWRVMEKLGMTLVGPTRYRDVDVVKYALENPSGSAGL